MKGRYRYKALFSAVALLSVAWVSLACAQEQQAQLTPIDYHQIDGWQEDDADHALNAFIGSCDKRKPQTTALSYQIDDVAWQDACKAAHSFKTSQMMNSKRFFEDYFQPYSVTSGVADTGLLTGYYIPTIFGSYTKSAKYNTPAYALPKMDKNPYFTRAEIAAGALNGKGLELVYISDPVDLFFMQVQGSGRVLLDTGGYVDLRYAGKNGHSYTAIGRTLIEMGEIDQKHVSVPTIRRWMKDHPDRAQEVMNSNKSYIFFTLGDAKQFPPGAQGVPLTQERSLAVDDEQIPYGIPVFIQTEIRKSGRSEMFNKLMIAQDTGSAIKGPMRGDIFFGQGDEAGHIAGQQKFQGKWTLLLPRQP